MKIGVVMTWFYQEANYGGTGRELRIFGRGVDSGIIPIAASLTISKKEIMSHEPA